MRRHVLTLPLVVMGALALSGCATKAPATPHPAPVAQPTSSRAAASPSSSPSATPRGTATQAPRDAGSTAPAATGSAPSPGNPSTGGSAGGGQLQAGSGTSVTDGRTSFPAVAATIDGLTSGPYTGQTSGWDANVFTTNWSSSAPLSYALIGTAGDPGGPKQILLFHNGQYLGPTIICHLRNQTVTGAGSSAVTVSYGLSTGDRKSITYVWSGDKVEMRGELPESEINDPTICNYPR